MQEECRNTSYSLIFRILQHTFHRKIALLVWVLQNKKSPICWAFVKLVQFLQLINISKSILKFFVRIALLAFNGEDLFLYLIFWQIIKV